MSKNIIIPKTKGINYIILQIKQDKIDPKIEQASATGIAYNNFLIFVFEV